MIYYKTSEEIEIIRKSALMVSATLTEVANFLKPGITLLDIDKVADTFIRDNGGVPSFKGYNGFPASLCISLNEEVVHGIPNDYVLQDGDIISVDCGVFMNGYHGDSAYTFAIGDVDADTLKLLKITKESLYKGIEQAVAGKRIGDIGWAIQEYTEKQHGYGVVRDLVGHGIGRKLHEDPQVPNYGRRGNGPQMKEGMVIAIEPMINMGTKDILFADDDWTVVTADEKPSAHFEHTVAVRKGAADILSSFEHIEAAEKKNPNLNSSNWE